MSTIKTPASIHFLHFSLSQNVKGTYKKSIFYPLAKQVNFFIFVFFLSVIFISQFETDTQ